MGRHGDGPFRPRLAIGLELTDNADETMTQTDVRAVVLGEQILVSLIGALQTQLQLMQRMAPGGDEDEPR